MFNLSIYHSINPFIGLSYGRLRRSVLSPFCFLSHWVFFLRCGHNFCASHRYAETHDCTYDYKSAGRRFLQETNPLVSAPKLPKIWPPQHREPPEKLQVFVCFLRQRRVRWTVLNFYSLSCNKRRNLFTTACFLFSSQPSLFGVVWTNGRRAVTVAIDLKREDLNYPFFLTIFFLSLLFLSALEIHNGNICACLYVGSCCCKVYLLHIQTYVFSSLSAVRFLNSVFLCVFFLHSISLWQMHFRTLIFIHFNLEGGCTSPSSLNDVLTLSFLYSPFLPHFRKAHGRTYHH